MSTKNAPVWNVPPAINGWNAQYIDEQYARWKTDPGAVLGDVAVFFQGFDLAVETGARSTQTAASNTAQTPGADPGVGKAMAVVNLIAAYRRNGHLAAKLDPFGRTRKRPAELELVHHGLAETDLETRFNANDIPGEGTQTLRQIVGFLEDTYCGCVGAECAHVPDAEERNWLTAQVEAAGSKPELTGERKKHILLQLHKAEMFETFLHKRYVGQKRFSLEGGESVIPLLDHLVQASPGMGVQEIVAGMAHRGRLNVLVNVLGKSYQQVFTEFEDNWDQDAADGGGDVKYHLGFSGERQTLDGGTVRVVMASNPSHLESVNGVVMGRTRAKQRIRCDSDRTNTMPVLLHGDAAFIGQGPVVECLNYSRLPGYEVGGTVHVVVNNLIGFTTGPEDARSSEYCTDSAKVIGAPVLHVNGQDPEAVVFAAELAMRYRKAFGKDIVIDMWCFRRWGHNEGDDPSFTQPVMAKLIKEKAGPLHEYAARLQADGVISAQDVGQMRKALDEQLEIAQSDAANDPHDPTIDPGSWRWQGFTHQFSFDPVDTAVERQILDEVAKKLSETPEGFTTHRTLRRLLEKRTKSVVDGESLDWGTAEALAFGSLLVEGNAVRVSGQDSRRGTFSHRHAVLRDNQTGDTFVPLNHIRQIGEWGDRGKQPMDIGDDGMPRQGRMCVYDSPLSEAGVLAFEYGYSLADPHMLVIWEAQFGDFANGAQVIIDQYIASAEIKWQRWSGLTLLLPHGYEGQGPEHSSARLERFLQLCADDNMRVANLTTPAQCFHALRRQVKGNLRKPLIVMSPKSLLRHPRALSPVDDLTDGAFQEIIDDPYYARGAAGGPDKARVKRVLLCSGKVYYDLVERREQTGRDDVAILRVEQLYPLHGEMLEAIVGSYPTNAERIWVQEEPKNMGAFMHVDLAVRDTLRWEPVRYVGRAASASPATGSKKRHMAELDEFLTEAVGTVGGAKKAAAGKEAAAAGQRARGSA